MRFIYRPLQPNWPSGQRTPWSARRRSPFGASWSQTMETLQRELRHLGVREDATIVFESGYRETDLRLDGLPKANARQPDDPGIVLAFESRFGPLRYGCDAFTDAESNIRAIALGLESLRRVDRYGISKRGEQYTGWLALPAAGTALSQQEAREWLREQIDQPWDGLSDAELLRRAAKRVHPDMPTGSRDQWVRYERAKAALA